MQKIDKAEYQKRLDRISEIFSGMVAHADELSTRRCPYKNRFDQCTAKFQCRNQVKSLDEGEPIMCGGDDRIDYRPAWEAAADGELNAMDPRKAAGAGTVTHDDVSSPSIAGRSIFDYADELSIQVPSSCGRNGICHECIVEIKAGMEALVERTRPESFLQEGFRLACQAVVKNPETDIHFSALRRVPKILSDTYDKPIMLEPLVTRQGDSVCYDGKIIDRYRGQIYGVAVDLGTTTVVLDLVDLETGESVCVSSFENPQRFGGSDVMNRISYDAKYRGELHKAITSALNHEVFELARRLDFDFRAIYEFVVVGNSTMRDIFFQIDVQSIGQKPYKSIIEEAFLAGKRSTTSLTEDALMLGLRANQRSKVYALPLIASHVGGDTAADLVAMDMASQEELVMLVDIGTNTEVVIGNRERLVAASCPAGPAFEGGLIKFGMPGCEGAIESIRLNDDSFDCHTIGDVAPQGICGSGLIDLLAELRRHKRMEPKGIFTDKSYEMTIVPDHGITFSREDASNLAQAKAANFCGQYIVMRTFGVEPNDITKLYLAGGFANYVNVQNAIEIGFMAPVAEDRIVKIGNAAVQGARETLLSRTKRESIESLVKGIEHVELETTPDFFDIFVEACQFKPMPKEIT